VASTSTIDRPAKKGSALSFSKARSTALLDAGAKAAQKAVDFFRRYLVHVDGRWAGQPFVLADWQERIVRDVFGTLRPDGTRRYRRVYIEVPRKSGKSTFGAGLALYLLTADGEPGAQVFGAADNVNQASIIWRTAARMAERSPDPELRSGLEALESSRTIVARETGAFYRVIPADAPSAHGLNPHGIVFDELHTQPNRRLYDALTTAQGARTQPLTFLFTTAGFDKLSVCYEEHQHALQVLRDPAFDESYYPVIFAADEKDDWAAEETWRKANPGYEIMGEPFRLYMHEQAERAKTSPGFQNAFKRLHLNLWTEQESRWLDMDAWDASAGVVDPLSLRRRKCFAGLDLGWTSDISALALVFPPLANEGYTVLMRYWVPEICARDRALRDRVPYPQWIGEGRLKATEGDVTDYRVIRKDITDLAAQYEIAELGYDPFKAMQLVLELQDDGVRMTPVRQGPMSLSGGMQELERLVLSGRLHHGGDPILRWQVSNVVVKQDSNGNIAPAKDRSADKIDGVTALVIALGRAIAPTTAPALPRWRLLA